MILDKIWMDLISVISKYLYYFILIIQYENTILFFLQKSIQTKYSKHFSAPLTSALKVVFLASDFHKF